MQDLIYFDCAKPIVHLIIDASVHAGGLRVGGDGRRRLLGFGSAGRSGRRLLWNHCGCCSVFALLCGSSSLGSCFCLALLRSCCRR